MDDMFFIGPSIYMITLCQEMYRRRFLEIMEDDVTCLQEGFLAKVLNNLTLSGTKIPYNNNLQKVSDCQTYFLFNI